MIVLEEGAKLLLLAKEAVKTGFDDRQLKVEPALKERFSEAQGVFVTIHEQGQLRGCIGFPEPIFPLWQAIIRAARAAAFDDPRFPPIEESEYEDLEFEVSVLTVPQKIEVENPDDYPSHIIIGRDGLIISVDGASGLLLPQVATEWHWNPKQFLENLCMKAGVMKDAWRSGEAEILKFQAQIFGEKDGKVVEKKI
ncbi:MAG: TIGR00296 family protein [Nanoarchaeota archaeon]